MKRGAIFLKYFLGAMLVVFFFAGITMMLWNWLVPVLFAGPMISFAQALGLLVLTKILFFGIGGKSHCAGHEATRQHWKNRFYEKISSLTPEEKEAFKRKMQDKWCVSPEKHQPKKPDASND